MISDSEEQTKNLHVESLQNPGIRWSDYAHHLDLMADLMPSYQENIDALLLHIRNRHLAGKVKIADLGAGTGIFCKAIAEVLPEAEITHVDFDSSMNMVARKKYEESGISNITIVEEHLQRVWFPPESFDLIVCVNVLYAVTPQRVMLSRIQNWLKRDGTLFIIDFGRKQSAIDWGLHFLLNALKGRNIRKYFRFLMFGQQITVQAWRGRKSQDKGKYWTHTTEAFGQFLSESGFAIEELRACHRNYADLAICHRVSNCDNFLQEKGTSSPTD